MLFTTARGGDKAMSYSTHLKATTTMFNDANFISKSKCHMARKSTAKNLENAG